MFVRERYFVTVNNLSGGDAPSAALVTFGSARSRPALPADRVPAELSLLPAAGRVPGSERLVRGPFGLQSIYHASVTATCFSSADAASASPGIPRRRRNERTSDC